MLAKVLTVLMGRKENFMQTFSCQPTEKSARVAKVQVNFHVFRVRIQVMIKPEVRCLRLSRS